MNTKKEFDTIMQVLALANVSLMMAFSPRLAYEMWATLWSTVLPVHHIANRQEVDQLLAYVAGCFMPLVAVDSYRAARVFSSSSASMGFLNVTVLIPIFMPVALSPLYAEFGDSAVIAAFIVWPIATLSGVAFAVAVSQVDAEREGREPSTLFLSVLYHLGGFVGVYYAKRLFPESKTCKAMLNSPPKGIVFLGCAIALCVFVKLL